jgi:catalase
MGFSPDKMLQGRLISYPDAHRYRIGVNYNLLPVNEPKCPYSTYNRDGSMRFNANGGASPNYEPNSFGGPTQDPKYVERPTSYGTSTVGRFSHREHDGDYYTQPGNLFRVMTPEQRKRLIGNIAASLSQTPRHIQERQLEHLYRADPAYGEGVGKALGIPVRELVAAK